MIPLRPELTPCKNPTGAPNGEKILIAVMGVTGAGKSTFIRTVTGREDVVVGDGLQSCTHTVTEYDMTVNGVSFTLVDVPGFNDTNIPDSEILNSIVMWLSKSYSESRKLSGILYLHKISENRMYGSAMDNLMIFRTLCGENFYKNIVLTTTHWSGDTPTAREVAREAELTETSEFWGLMTRRGSQMRRYLGTRQSALDILNLVVNFPPNNVRIQEEIVDEGKNINETATGKLMNEKLEAIRAQFEKKLRETQETLKAEKDAEIKAMLEKERIQNQARIDEAARQQKMLNMLEDQMRALRIQQQQQQQQQHPAPAPAPAPAVASAKPTARSLRKAIEAKDTNTALRLIKQGASLYERDHEGQNALHYAAYWGQLKVVKALIEEMNNLDKIDMNGRTALHLAAGEGYPSITEELLQNHAKDNIKDKNGRTPLHRAAYYGKVKTAETLIEYGAKVHVKDKNGKTPKMLAKEQSHPGTASMLRSYE